MVTEHQSARTGTRTLSVECRRSINEFSEHTWDSVASKQGLFWTHRFFQVVEKSGVEQAEYYYLVFSDGDKPVGSAVLSAFDVSLALLLPSLFQNLVQSVRRFFDGFLRIRILFCGIPVSIGKHTIAVADNSYLNEIMIAISDEMHSIAERNNIHYLCLKEFQEPEHIFFSPLKRLGFFKANSIPRFTLDIRWPDFGSYLSSLRHSYRRLILKSLNKLSNQSRTQGISAYDPELPSGPSLVTVDTNTLSSSQFHQLYLQVMKRTPTKLEILDQSFFDCLSYNLHEQLVQLAVVDGPTPLAVAILCLHDRTLTFLFVGIDYERRDECDAYLNLLSGIIAYGIEKGCTTIDLGQTSHWLKQRIGGNPTSMYFFFKSRRRFIHALLRILNGVLFPPTRLQQLRVFRS
jgi:predicted N-acyltransferase